MQQDPRQIYEQALHALLNDQYDDALFHFQNVKQLVPIYPFIDQNIIQCKSLKIANKQYLKARDLMNRRNFIQALFHLDYTERSIQPDFKDCRQLAQECRDQFWLDQLCKLLNKIENQIDPFQGEENQLQLNDQIPILNNIYQEFNQAHLRQNQFSNIRENEQEIENQANQADEKIAIYFKCIKTNLKCIIQRQSQEPFKHSSCRTTAYLNANGIVSCDLACEKYSIYDARFSCTKQEVSNDQLQDLEAITSLLILADFVENCLIRNQLSEARQANFRVKLPMFVFPEMTRRGLI